MERRRFGRSTGARLILLAAAGGLFLLGGGRASGGDPPDDGAPAGTVTYFTGGMCPSGWKAMDDLQGRLAVAVVDPLAAGVKVGKPLGDAEDRTHVHPFKASVDLPDKSIAGADGNNNNGAAAGKYTITGTTDPAATGLPFIQVQACVKQ